MAGRMDKSTSASLLRTVVSEFSDVQKQTMRDNLQSGRTLLCGERAYMFCDENAGCLLTMATTTNIPTDKYDFKRVEQICVEMAPVYNNAVKKYGLDYYHATQVIDCKTLTKLVKELVGL